MRKGSAVIMCLALLMALPFGSAEQEDPRLAVNPKGYTCLEVYDIFSNDDAEMDENGDFYPVSEERPVIVQASFGDFTTLEGENGPERVGFDENEIYALGVSKDCQVMLPPDLMMDPGRVEPIADIVAWYQQTLDVWTKEISADEPFTFYVLFEMNEAGELSKLEYLYLP